VDKHWLQQSEAEATAFEKLCRAAFACEVEAQQALATFTQALQTTARYLKTPERIMALLMVMTVCLLSANKLITLCADMTIRVIYKQLLPPR
jgi:ferric-dicitrate binding protein FerR (iron transport regulator)